MLPVLLVLLMLVFFVVLLLLVVGRAGVRHQGHVFTELLALAARSGVGLLLLWWLGLCGLHLVCSILAHFAQLLLEEDLQNAADPQRSRVVLVVALAHQEDLAYISDQRLAFKLIFA